MPKNWTEIQQIQQILLGASRFQLLFTRRVEYVSVVDFTQHSGVNDLESEEKERRALRVLGWPMGIFAWQHQRTRRMKTLVKSSKTGIYDKEFIICTNLLWETYRKASENTQERDVGSHRSNSAHARAAQRGEQGSASRNFFAEKDGRVTICLTLT